MKKRILGEKIEFRNLTYAPVNELGVVFLFGLLHESLGFLVESIQPGYPDCIAKRRLAAGKWEHLRVEFEFESKAFQAHKHDPEQVDVIVCWKHNWREPPENIEVIELRSYISNSSSQFIEPPQLLRLSPWQTFCSQMRKQGYGFKEISKLWREKQRSSGRLKKTK